MNFSNKKTALPRRLRGSGSGSSRWSGIRIAILGFGTENQAVLKWLARQGAKDITICDKNPNIKFQIPNLKFQTGKNYLKNLEQFDIVFRTPGISYLNPEIQKAKKAGVEISSQMKLFFDLSASARVRHGSPRQAGRDGCPAKIIGVTGTKGKGTTVALISAILKNKETKKPRNVWTGGNIGNPPIAFLDRIKPQDWVVLELSSFQLQDMTKSPHIAVVLDIKSDHLDYHRDRKEYIEAKMNIVRYQSKKDFAVINLDYLTSFKFAAVSPSDQDYYFSRRKSVDLGCYVEWLPRGRGAHFGKIILRTPRKDYEICKTYDITLRGEHNLENICAAITASYLAGAKISAIRKVIPRFRGLEHRLEYVAGVEGVKYYNDSFSTTPDTAIAAIKSFSEPIILLIGGSEKKADYSQLGREIIKGSVKTVIPIGKTARQIIKALKDYNKKVAKKIEITKDCKTMEEAVRAAYNQARPGDVVLLSPASASFDRFKNYKDRGNQFKFAIANLKNPKS